MIHKIGLIALVGVALSACGGSSSGGSGSKSGQFKDSNTSGLTYSLGGQKRITGADGGFEYQDGEQITFSVGGVELGSTVGQPIVTPIDVIAGGNSNAVDVQNSVRFLLMLDKDGNPSNGIEISPEVQSVAEQWSQIDFSSSTFESDVAQYQADAVSVDGTSHELPTSQVAKAHLEETFRCAYSGGFSGRYSGSDVGTFGFLVNAADGEVVGVSYSERFDELGFFQGSVPVSADRSRSFISGSGTSSGNFSGAFEDANRISGTWSDGSDSGSFSGNRIGGAADAKYRFTGAYTGTDYGLFTFDIDANNRVTGISYSVQEDSSSNLTGTLNGTQVSIQSNSGGTGSGTLNLQTGELSGNWSNSTFGESGQFGGSGCQLN